MYSSFAHRGGQYLIVLIITIVCLSIPLHAFAQNKQSKNSFKVDPAFIEIDILRDTADKQFPIKYSNFSSQPIQVNLSFLPVTFASKDEKMLFPITKSILSSHIIPSTDSFLIGPGETKTILLSLADLDLLSSADYYEALSARVSTQELSQKAPGASVIANITTLLLVKNGGADTYPEYAFEDGSFSLPFVIFNYPEKVSIRLSNSGKTYGIPRGLLTMNDMLGRQVVRAPLNIDSVRIFPGSVRLFDAKLILETLSLPMYVGKYTLSIYDAYVGEKSQLKDTRTFLYIDPLFGVLALVVAPAYVVFLKYASNVKKRRQAMDSATRSAGK